MGILRATTQQDAGEVSGGPNESPPNSLPTSYSTGGFSLKTSLDRVDAAHAELSNGSWETVVTSASTDNNNSFFTVEVYSQGTAGNEAEAGTDFSGDQLTYVAHKL